MSLKYLKSHLQIRNSVFRLLSFQICRKKHTHRNVLKIHERGMYEDIFPENSSDEIVRLLVTKPRCVYAGFDPTANSLHVGNLLILMNLLHWQRAGHQVITLIGTATALIGDPSGRLRDREQHVFEVVREQAFCIQKNIETIFSNHEKYFWSKTKDASPLSPIKMLNNHEWYKNQNIIHFINNVGRNFRMGAMLAKDSVQKRLNSEYGMCFSEFTYQIFQAYDWYHLLKNHNCRFQIGGKDQMGNIVAGYNFIKRLEDISVHGLTLPLITTDAGDKFGKSLPNAIWLDKKLTSPFEFYQFFLRTHDDKVEQFLKFFTFESLENIEILMEKQKAKPEKRIAHTKLAEEVTLLVHGVEGLEIAKTTTNVLYHSDIESLSKIPSNELPKILKGAEIVDMMLKPGYTVLQFALDIPCFFSKTDALRIIDAGAFYINMQKVKNVDEVITQAVHILPNNTTIVRVGKKHYWIVRWNYL